MKEFEPLPVVQREPVDIASLPSEMSLDDARQLLGFPTTDGRKIIGVTTKPGLGHADGLYITIASRFTKAVHQRVGNES